MARSFLSKRHKVKRFHTKDRRRGYVTPSERDVKCPYYDGHFACIGKADVTDDYIAICNADENVSCDYQETLDTLKFCKRYWKNDMTTMKLLQTIKEDETGDWQNLKITYNFQRLFKEKYATVSVILTQTNTEQIDLGNFLKEWKEWHENQKGDWHQITSNGVLKIYNAMNQTGRSFWYNPNHVEEMNYAHSYYVQTLSNWDDDLIGSIFRYNPKTGHFYSFEWDSGGTDVKGMAIYRNYRNSNGSYTKTRLAYSNIKWETAKYYIHEVIIEVRNTRITTKVYRVSGSNKTLLATLEVNDTALGDKMLKGAWGPMTNSQPDTYFWNIQFEQIKTLDATVNSKLKKDIPLEYIKQDGSHYVVSKPIDSYFKDDIEEVLMKNGIDPMNLKSKEYMIVNHNVFEGIYFYPHNVLSDITIEPNSVIAMSSFNYGNFLSYDRIINIPKRQPSITTDIFTLTRDMSLLSIYILADKKHLFDFIQFDIKKAYRKVIPNVNKTSFQIDFSNHPVPIEVNESIVMTYTSSNFNLEIYEGDYIDTHDKLFTIKDNILGWHIVPSRE